MGVLNLSWSGSFPFCLVPALGIWDGTGDPTGYVGNGTYYPIGVTLEEAMRWYWQVSQWTDVAEFAFSGTSSESPYEFDEPLSNTLVIPGAASQQALVCAGGPFASDGISSFELCTDTPYAYTYGGLVYPYIYMTWILTDVITFSTYKLDLAFPKVWPNAGIFDDQTFTIWYDEASYYDSVDGGTGDHGPWTQTRGGTATITADSTF